MTLALEDFEDTVTVGGRKVNNLRFADDIDLIAGSSEEFAELTERLDRTTSQFGMEISAPKSKIMLTPAEPDEQVDISDGGVVLEGVNDFKYLGAHISQDITSEREVKTKLAIATGHLAKFKKVLISKDVSTKSKVNILRAVVLSTALYGCEA